VALNWADLASIAVLVTAGCAVSYAILQRTIRRAVLERQQATERQLSALAVKVKALEARVAELNQILELQPEAASEFDMEAAAAAAEDAVAREDTEVTPEMMAVITEAASAFLGKKVHVLSAKLLEQPHEVISPWSQQGRVFVQASHNLRPMS
jgi:hypothetical protein